MRIFFYLLCIALNSIVQGMIGPITWSTRENGVRKEHNAPIVFYNPQQPIRVACNKNFAIVLSFSDAPEVAAESWKLSNQNLLGLKLLTDYIGDGNFSQFKFDKKHIFAFVATQKFHKNIEFVARIGPEVKKKVVNIETFEEK